MSTDEVVVQARALQERIKGYATGDEDGNIGEAAKAQVCEFLRAYAGPKSAFLKQAEAARGYAAYLVTTLDAILTSFIQYLQAGLATGLSPERRAQLDVVSDILGQANHLLDDNAFHPGSAAMLIGAALEEFLRTWVEDSGMAIGNAKPGIDTYAKALRSGDVISKQDSKDITAWAGIRNHAAHGDWEQVAIGSHSLDAGRRQSVHAAKDTLVGEDAAPTMQPTSGAARVDLHAAEAECERLAG